MAELGQREMAIAAAAGGTAIAGALHCMYSRLQRQIRDEHRQLRLMLRYPGSGAQTPEGGTLSPSGREPRLSNSSFGGHINLSMIGSSVAPALGVAAAEQLFAMCVAGDIGGTNSRLQLYRVPALATLEPHKRAPGISIFEKKYKNDGYQTFEACMKQFIQDAEKGNPGSRVAGNIAACCLAVAGPVQDNKVVFTNRASWVIDGTLLADALSIPKVRLINDFVAQGFGILTLDESKDCEVISQPGINPVNGAPKVCIGPGTGLGECFLTTPHPNAAYEVFPSEGAHAEWAPRVDPREEGDQAMIQFKLLMHLIQRFNQRKRISVERIVSGPGLSNVYEFLVKEFPGKVNAAVHKEYEAASEKGMVISQNAGEPDKPGDFLCHMTMGIFASAYGSEVGVAGLKWMPFGGIYLVGGITPKNMPWVRGTDGPFMTAFHDKGRVAPLLKSVPVYAVQVDDVGERGAHLAAVQMLGGHDLAPDAPAARPEARVPYPKHDAAGKTFRRMADKR